MTSTKYFESPIHLVSIPWYPISSKGQDFNSRFKYLGFDWDLSTQTVSLPAKKQQHIITKLTLFLDIAFKTVSQRDCASLHSSLQHIAFVCHEGCSALPALASFLSKFPHVHVCHHISPMIICNVCWWIWYLTSGPKIRSLLPHTQINPWIFVDASTSWGIRLHASGKWVVWELNRGWNAAGRDISWAESITLEITALWLIQANYKDLDILIHSDNTGVIGAFNHSRARNFTHNNSIAHITSLLLSCNLIISPIFVPSSLNKAGGLSRGIRSPLNLRLTCILDLPFELCPWLMHI